MTRKLGFAAFTLLSLLVATSAFSLPCQSETITFYGYLMSDGSVWCNPPIIGPEYGRLDGAGNDRHEGAPADEPARACAE